MVTQIQSGSVYSDSIIYFRDVLNTNITDPISGSRPTSSKFVMTSYPQRSAIYPLIIVRDGNMQDQRLGLNSEASLMTQDIVLTVMARNIAERDKISQQVYNFMRTNQFGTGSETVNFGFHDYRLESSINILRPDENGKDTGVRTKEMIYRFMTVIQ